MVELMTGPRATICNVWSCSMCLACVWLEAASIITAAAVLLQMLLLLLSAAESMHLLHVTP
jgi:hypothetical protein